MTLLGGYAIVENVSQLVRNTDDSRYFELQSNILDTSMYPYFDSLFAELRKK